MFPDFAVCSKGLKGKTSFVNRIKLSFLSANKKNIFSSFLFDFLPGTFFFFWNGGQKKKAKKLCGQNLTRPLHLSHNEKCVCFLIPEKGFCYAMKGKWGGRFLRGLFTAKHFGLNISTQINLPFIALCWVCAIVLCSQEDREGHR